MTHRTAPHHVDQDQHRSEGRIGSVSRFGYLSVAVAGLVLVTAACGSGAADPNAAPTSTPTSTPASDSVPAGGWIDGEPAWRGEADGELYESSVGVDSDSATLEAADKAGEETGAVPPIEESNSPLRAGYVDDNDDYAGYLAYLDRIAQLGISTRDFDATGRTVITVIDEDGRRVAGAAVEVIPNDGSAPVQLRTTADGTARFHPALVGLSGADALQITAGGETVSAIAGTEVTVVGSANELASPVPLDVLFLLDATGSMGDEIGRLKETIDTVAQRVTALDPAPDVRFAMTLYRDEGDAFVTATYDFTGDVVEFQAALNEVVADGGGDYPEALDEGLAEALAAPSWRDPSEAIQLVFLVADAPPQVSRQVTTPYTESINIAVERGIKIFPVASSESDDQAEAVFRQLAQATGAPFVFLSSGAAGASVGENTDIASTDYEELALDELVVRLIAEEIADIDPDGSTVVIPTTTAPSTTNPDGQ